MFKAIFVILSTCAIGLSACKRGNSESANSIAHSATASADSCGLITKQEVGGIEASSVTDTKNSGRSDGGLSFGQCFYTTKEFNRSVSLAVTRPDPNGQTKRSIKDYWEGMFGKYENSNERDSAKNEALEQSDKEKSESLREQTGERGEERESTPPKKVANVGDAAFWVGSRVGGALYVLNREAVLRISVGGPDSEEKKIEKCKALAEKALGRL